MKKEKLNRDWLFAKGIPTLMSAFLGGPQFKKINLPHDAMIHEDRKSDTPNGAQTGFYPGGAYTYIKKIFVPKNWKDKTVLLEFEGVYSTAMVYINEELAQTNLYGYSDFYVAIDQFLKYGQENEIKVIADNGSEKNSRWYTGSGIYRDVYLLTGNGVHIEPDGLRISTLEISGSDAEIEVDISLKSILKVRKRVDVRTIILYEEEPVAEDTTTVTMFSGAREKVIQRFYLPAAKLWNVDTPRLYKCRIDIIEKDENEILDTETEQFGIRKLSLNSVKGLCINGESVKLRGACIHHDNGIIGAATLEMAEDRRCRQLKEAGFNSIRSSHNPLSKAMLRACDRYGVLVMDELCDMWSKHKNPNDFALHFSECADEEIRRMVAKDYNHPSVVLYSVGNEILEVGTPYGAKVNRHLCNTFHNLDPSRYTTNGISGMLALGDRMVEVLKDVVWKKNPGNKTYGKEEGASVLNELMASLDSDANDAVSRHPVMSETIKESSEAMDVIGLNYLTGRHIQEKELHPYKCVLGTETYPADMVRLWNIVKNNSHVIGDFTWTGYDYLGEAGCGIIYYDGTVNFSGVYPDRAAYIGDINLIGYRRPNSYLREIVYGLRKEPYIAVEKVDKYGLPHSQTEWMKKDTISSWTWPGYEGKPAKLAVYSPSEEVEVFLNGISLGRRPAGETNGFTADYDLVYQPGELTAVSYQNGKENGRYTLKTANDDVQMRISVENLVLKSNGEDLAFLTIQLTDSDGNDNLYVQKEIKISVEGYGTLQGFGNADPQSVESYDSVVWKTFEGQVMAVIKAGVKAGEIKVRFESEDMETKEAVIKVAAIT